MDFLNELRRQFEGGEGSFILKLRTEYKWDKESFSHLIEAMKLCCERFEQAEALERWLIQGFWYHSIIVREITTHPNFPREHDLMYYERAFKRLSDLADWFFMGYSPYESETGFAPL
jgi:hypothetical protein